uniref:Uncharacterized protein n=1 Tax=Gopherus evgoodei TaxID=1825980 RepID=A0A8C4VVR8_9SAUR
PAAEIEALPPGPQRARRQPAVPPVTPPALASAPVQGKSSPARVAPPTPSETMPPMPAEETPMLPLDDVRYQIACTNWY